MLAKTLLILNILIFIALSMVAQSMRFAPKYKTILNLDKTNHTLAQCSRGVPKKINGFWKLTQIDLDILENNFNRIYKLKASECCILNNKVDDLNTFAFQFIGIIINGKKNIYCNAFRVDDEFEHNNRFDYWLTDPVIICDGGYDYWGVLFDLETKRFKNLAFNGGG